MEAIMTGRGGDALNGIGFGTWAWGNQLLWGYDAERDDRLLEETFRQALASGLGLIDTADSYGTGRLNGRSEQLLGRFAARLPATRRADLCIAPNWRPSPGGSGDGAWIRRFRRVVSGFRAIYDACSCTGALLATPPGRRCSFSMVWRIAFWMAPSAKSGCPTSARNGWPGCSNAWRSEEFPCAVCRCSIRCSHRGTPRLMRCDSSAVSVASRCWPTARLLSVC